MAGLLTAAQISDIQATITASLDQSLPLYRNTLSADGYGHNVETRPGTPTSTIACNTYRPSATHLQAFASVIGTQEAMMLRFMSTSDVQEGDLILYKGEYWKVQSVLNNESYSWALDALMTTIS